MRYQTALTTALPILPVPAAAHTGPHAGIEPVAGMLHLLTHHAAPGLAAALAAALLIAVYRYAARRRQHIRIHRKDHRT